MTYNVASTARAAAARRRFHELKAGGTRPQTIAPDALDDLGSVVFEELRRLPDRYRAAVVLCCLEGLTQQQAAMQLGWPLGTVQSRLARGRDRLRVRLARRGVAPALGAAIAPDLAKATRAEMPEGLPNSVIRAAVRFSEGYRGAGVVSASVSDLITRVSRTMLMKQLKMATALTVAVGALAGVAVLAQDATKSPSNSLPAPLATRPVVAPLAGRGTIAIPGPPPGLQIQLVFAVVSKLTNTLTLECEDHGRIRATLSRGEGPKVHRVFKAVSIVIDSSREAPDGPDSLGDPVVEATDEGDVLIFPGPKRGEPMHLSGFLMGKEYYNMVIASEVGDRFRVKFFGDHWLPPSGDAWCSAIRFDAIYAAD